jgi:hypothetical protein
MEVRFEPVADAAAAARLDGLIAFGEDPGGPARRIVLGEPGTAGGPDTVTFSGRVDARLRGRTLREDAVPGGLSVAEGDEVLAQAADGRALWLRRDGADHVACAPAELGPGEFLRDRASPGRFLELLPLVHFLRELTADVGWRPPPPRATFVVDDPNLHWRSYGHIDYPELVRHAREHAYHIVMAMVPLDAWFADPRAARLFRENPDVVSLCFHGNDHRRHDLEQPSTREEARAVLARAAARIGRFERRAGVPVSRVMVPPHEACSEATMSAMAEAGFEAASSTRPYLWVDFGTPPSPYNSPWPDRHLLCGWRIAELMPDGFPVMLRREFHEHDDAVLRAFFDQPVILYGHASDFAGGLEPLERAAAHVNSLPGMRWTSLSEMAAMNFETRVEGATLRLRPYARRVRVDVPPEVREVVVEPPHWAGGFDDGFEVSVGRAEGNAIALPERGAGTVEIRWRAGAAAPERPARRIDGPARARRVLAEARDRLQPLRR